MVQSHEPRATSDEERKKKGSKVRRSHSETPVGPLVPITVASAHPSAVSDGEKEERDRSQPSYGERQKEPVLSGSVTPKTQSNETVIGGTKSLKVDLESLAKAKTDGVESDGSAGRDGNDIRKNSPTRRDGPEDQKVVIAPARAGPEHVEPTKSPRKKEKPGRERSDGDGSGLQETTQTGDDKGAKKSSTPGKIYAELSRGVRTHLRAASDSLHGQCEEDKERSKEKNLNGNGKNEKKEKHDKKDNVIVRLLAGTKDKDKAKEKELERERDEKKEAEPQLADVDSSIPVPQLQVTTVHPRSGFKTEVEIPITAPSTSPVLPLSPYPAHKSGIRLIKVDSEACVTLPLYNSEIVAHKTSSKAVRSRIKCSSV